MTTKEEIKGRFSTAESILNYLGIIKYKRISDGYSCSCAFHSEKTDSMVVFDDGHVHCFGACGFHGDIFNIVAHQNRLDVKDDFVEILKILGGEVKQGGYTRPSVTPPQKVSSPKNQLHIDLNSLSVLKNKLYRNREVWQWLVDRVADPDILKEFNLFLIDDCHPQIVTTHKRYPIRGIAMPLWTGDEIYHVEVRHHEAIQASMWQKKYMSVGSYRFGYEYQVEKSGDIHVIESKRDALLLMSILGEKRAVSAPANHLNSSHIAFLAQYDTIFLWTDSDTAGGNNEQKYKDAFTTADGKCNVITVTMPKDMPKESRPKDLGELWLLSQRETYDIIQSTLERKTKK